MFASQMQISVYHYSDVKDQVNILYQWADLLKQPKNGLFNYDMSLFGKQRSFRLSIVNIILIVINKCQSSSFIEREGMRNKGIHSMTSCRLKQIFFFLVCLSVSWSTLSRPLVLRGDGLEYIVQTQSIALFSRLNIDISASSEYWNATNPFNFKLSGFNTTQYNGNISERSQVGGGFGSLYPAYNSHYYYLHFWGFSLLVAPLYLLFHYLAGAGAEYYSFLIVNLFLFFCPFYLHFRKNFSWYSLVMFSLFVCSPVYGYLSWCSPEIMCFSFVVLALHFASERRLLWFSFLLIGAASAQYPPIIFVQILVVLLALDNFVSYRQCIKIAFLALPGIALCLLPLVFYKYHFDSYSLATKLGFMQLERASFTRALDLFINPFIGCLWFFSPILLFFFLDFRIKALPKISGFVALIVMSYLMSGMDNIHSGFYVCERYTIWLLAPLFFFCIFDSKEARMTINKKLVLLLSVCLIAYFSTWRIIIADENWAINRVSAETLRFARLLNYVGSPQVFLEVISKKEIEKPHQFDAVYHANFGDGGSLWLVSKRSLRSNQSLSFSAPEAQKCNDLKQPFICENGTLKINASAIADWRYDSWLGSYQFYWLPFEV